MDAQCSARDYADQGKAEKRGERDIEDKESVKWLDSYRAVANIQEHCPQTTFVVVGDRESDIHELVATAIKASRGPKLLIRSEQSRKRLIEEGYLWEVLREELAQGHFEVSVPRRGPRRARDARLEVRFRMVTLRPPKRLKDAEPLSLWAVHLREVDYPEDVNEPLEWLLLTTIPTRTFDEAITIAKYYTQRWGIELYHRVLKSGCRIEDRQLETAERLQPALGIDMIVAYRVLQLLKAGRETPELPCTVLLEDHEWRALVWRVTRKPPPEQPPCLRDAVRMIAGLGGFLGRKRDGEPGMTTLWRGLVRLSDIAEDYLLFAHPTRAGPTARVNNG